jgi:serine/threonine protein kinase
MKVDEEFKNEVENLQILKESLTTHRNIMLHLATITHGLHHYILLPYAKHGDLEVFLHCGIDQSGSKIYDFNQRFRNVERKEDLAYALFHQSYLLADALDWLHSGIRVGLTANRIFCAHMDLKPSNVLVEHDEESPIGRWMLSDFGISVFKEESTRHDSVYVSIGDYYSQITMNTRPKRHEGTYQAPEVKASEDAADQVSQLTPDQRGIGRKSDVWSFGCIFSEVLAFALGRNELVKRFQMVRKGEMANDYFYMEEGATFLAAPNAIKKYQLRPSIVKWLKHLPETYAHPRNWLNCCVGTILKVLKADADERPTARELQELAWHVLKHLKASRSGDDLHCPILNPNKTPPLPQDNNTIALPKPSTSISIMLPDSINNPPHALENEPLSQNRSSSVAAETESTLITEPDSNPPSAHRASINPDRRIELLSSSSCRLRTQRDAPLCSAGTIIDVSLTSLGNLAAYLVGCSIHIFDIELKKNLATEKLHFPLLPDERGWKSVAVAGSYVVAWGHSRSRGKKLVRTWLEVNSVGINRISRLIMS